MIYSILWHWFDWPNGSVLTNLIASLFWGSVAFIAGRLSVRSVHKKLDDHHELLQKLHDQREKD